MIANTDDPHLRLHVHNAHFILGLDGADGLYARAVLVLLVFSVFYEPADGRGRRLAEKKCSHVHRRRAGNALVVQHVCIKLLLGDEVVLHALLLVRLLGSSGVCGNTQHSLPRMRSAGGRVDVGQLTRNSHSKMMWVFSNHPLFEFVYSRSKRTFTRQKEIKPDYGQVLV